MSVSPLHILQQGPVIASIARTAWLSLNQKKSSSVPPPPTTPGREYTEQIPPRPDILISDYIRHVGGDQSIYKGTIPFHLYPQWGFPLLARTLSEIPYNLTRVLNAGCSITINHQLPIRTSFRLRAHLHHVDVNERRAILSQRLVTETAELKDALVVEQTAIVPFPGGPRGVKKAKPRVPVSVREIGSFRVGPNSGLEFAVLTGDVNPLHWIPAYARAFGHPSPILHGFSTMARSVEILNRALWAGDFRRLRKLTVRFTRPLRLPAKVGVFIDCEGGVFAGDAPGGPAYLVGQTIS